MPKLANRERLRRPIRKSGFTYVPRKPEDIKKRAERPSGRFDSIFKPGFDRFTAKQGENQIRILPPTWDNHDHYGYTAYVHSYVGPDNSTYLCPRKMLNKSCPICDAAEEARKAGEDEEAKALAVKEQAIYWVIDRDGDPDKPMLYTVSGMMDREILSLTISNRSGKVVYIDHPDEGHDLIMRRQGHGKTGTRYTPSIDHDPTPISDDEKEQEDVLEFVQENPIPTVLRFYSEEYLDKVISGTAAAKDEELDEEEDEEAEAEEAEEDTRSSRRRREREEQEDREVRSARKTRSRRDEEEEEEEEPAEEEEETEDEEEAEAEPEEEEAEAEDEEEEPEEETEDEEEEEEEREPVRAARRGNGRERRERRPAREERRARRPVTRTGRRGREDRPRR